MTFLRYMSLLSLAFFFTACGGGKGIKKQSSTTPTPNPNPSGTPAPIVTPTPTGNSTPTPAPTQGVQKRVSISNFQVAENVCTQLTVTLVSTVTTALEIRIGLDNGNFIRVFSNAGCTVPFTALPVANGASGTYSIWVKARTPINRNVVFHPGVFIGGTFDNSFGTTAGTISILRQPQSEWHYRNFVDLNGDQKTDILKPFIDGGSFISIDGHFSSGPSYNIIRLATRLPAPYASFPNDQIFLTGDFDGNGITDLASIWGAPGNPVTANIDVYGKGTSNDWTVTRWGTGQGAKFADLRWFAMDVNGDGRTDIVKVWGEQSGSQMLTNIDVHLSNGTSFTMNRWATQQGVYERYQQFLIGDFNGDAKMDLARVRKVYVASPTPHYETCLDVFTSTGSAFVMANWASNQGWYSDEQKYVAADFNGDFKTDIAKYWNESNQWTIDVHTSNGSSFAINRWATTQGGFDLSQRWILLDVNNDGKMDFANVFNSQGNAFIDAHLSSGTNFGIARWADNSGSLATSFNFFAADLDGDGLDDLAKHWNFNDTLYIDGHFNRNSRFVIGRMGDALGAVFSRLYMRFFPEGIQGPAAINFYRTNDPTGQIMKGPQ